MLVNVVIYGVTIKKTALQIQAACLIEYDFHCGCALIQRAAMISPIMMQTAQ